MNKLMAAVFLVVYAAGAAGSMAWAVATGATYLLGLLLWTSFFGFCAALGLMLFHSREHWLG